MICMPVQVQREGYSTPKTIAVAVAFDKSAGKGGKYVHIRTYIYMNMCVYFIYSCFC